MPCNARRPAASQAHTKTPTLCLSLPKLPVPEVPDNGEDPVNDEMEEQVDEKDIETQSEDPISFDIITKVVKINIAAVWVFEDNASDEWADQNHLCGVYQHEVVLSDPVILAWNQEYGVTNLGSDGISSFFSQHKCNNYCHPTWTQPARRVQHFRPVPERDISADERAFQRVQVGEIMKPASEGQKGDPLRWAESTDKKHGTSVHSELEGLIISALKKKIDHPIKGYRYLFRTDHIILHESLQCLPNPVLTIPIVQVVVDGDLRNKCLKRIKRLWSRAHDDPTS
ncbi:hypothetical protein BDBG_00885 [Blastomyces gilchristii SLH14081]|uniref:Alpha-type protein kinase domain-containing protein n=1 Tax=Blastomyces gilchristii (strain SLH14081) TaxID=559298 RepID=A0A179U8I2_BLAGS|nr:uncharacterized protein BDBG_00885 [Blastomyces gilchristii SLH14081]OAT04306.1 hypothetical protein BDBG_00885 [Blastomyces gilchristii SLH14081]